MPLLPRSRDKTSLDRPPLSKPKKGRIGEITTEWARDFRDSMRRLRRGFWPTATNYGRETLSYADARRLYRNTDKNANLGSGFGRRIVNSVPDFMGLPMSATGDEIVDEFLNNGIQNYWAAELQQAIREAVRDGDTVLRVRRHNPDNPLISPDEWETCYLEVVPPETVAIYYSTDGDTTEIARAYVRHEVDMVIEGATSDSRALRQPQVRTHVIIEEITPTTYRYWDESEGEWLDDQQRVNPWGFVELVEVFNEFDSAVEGGQSDFEGPLPFIMAFHDVLQQSLVSHKAHAIPKATFKVHDMMNFIANNWPDSFERDELGQIDPNTFNGQISWKGTEMIFVEPDEDVGFAEVTSSLGDSKTLLDFLLTCIAIASETPKSVLMDQTAQDADEMIPFSKKIERKRYGFTKPIQQVCKMVLAINFMEPTKVPLAWEDITPDIALKKSQALQQDVMSYEVLATREVISDATIRRSLKRLIPAMKSGTEETADAKKNVVPVDPATGGASTASGSDAGNKKTTGNQN